MVAGMIPTLGRFHRALLDRIPVGSAGLRGLLALCRESGVLVGFDDPVHCIDP